ncbi:MAG: hypothetical protein ABEN55_08110, partial [Bradymonadaceae bacterium]
TCDPYTCTEECYPVETKPETCPAGGSGGQCRHDGDCSAEQVCVDNTCRPDDQNQTGKAGVCQSCQTAYDCADASARCVALGDSVTDGKICSPTCRGNSDCADGLECIKRGDGPGQCLPEKNGDGNRTCTNLPNTECTSAGDCQDGETCVDNSCQPPADAECQKDADCDGSKVCKDFECRAPEKECIDRTDCRSDETCINSQCMSRNPSDGCTFNSECGDQAMCVDGRCLSRCEDREDCNPREYCRLGLCQPIECRRNADCASGEVCVEARCTDACASDGDCGDGYVCNANGYCEADDSVECRSNAECAQNEICSNGECQAACQCNQDCADGQVCDSETNTCRAPNQTQPSCEDDCDCPSGQTCNDSGKCVSS